MEREIKLKAHQLVKKEDPYDRIVRVRGRHIMLGPDLARRFQVPTKVIMQAVRRNRERFPPDFMFRLTWIEVASLARSHTTSTARSQFVTLESGMNIKYRPFAFTEEGVAMLSAVLRSPTAVRVSIAIIRAFIKLRHAVLANRDLGRRIEHVEGRLHITETDIRLLQDDLRSLKKTPELPQRKVRGFQSSED